MSPLCLSDLGEKDERQHKDEDLPGAAAEGNVCHPSTVGRVNLDLASVPPHLSIHLGSTWLSYFYSSRVRPARGLWFSRTPEQTKCIFALHFSKTSTVVIVCTADGWSIICHHVAGVRRQHNNTNLFHIIQAVFKSISGISILKPSGGEIQQKLVQ